MVKSPEGGSWNVSAPGPQARGPAAGTPAEAEPPRGAGRSGEPLLRSSRLFTSHSFGAAQRTAGPGQRSPSVARPPVSGRGTQSQPRAAELRPPCAARSRAAGRASGPHVPARRPRRPQRSRGGRGAVTRAPTPTAAPRSGTKGAGRRGPGRGRGRKVGAEAGPAEGTGRASAGRAARAAVNGRLGGGGRAAGEFQELQERAAAGVAERPDSGPRRSCRRRRAGAQP